MPATPIQPAIGHPSDPHGQKDVLLTVHPKREWMSTFGAFADDPIFDSAMDAGEAWGKAQTWESEQAALNAHAGA